MVDYYSSLTYERLVLHSELSTYFLKKHKVIFERVKFILQCESKGE